MAGKRIVVLGAGFGGLAFCRAFRHPGAEIVLVDRQNHHLFQPLLYQVATAGLSVPDIARPIRQILADKERVKVILDEVVGIDPSARAVRLRESRSSLPYDYLVLALGARTHYFGHDEWEQYAPGLKSLDDATRIRRRVLLAFEKAETCPEARERGRLMTLVVIGAGPTGVELAGALAELARLVLKQEFREIDTAQSRVVLIEAAPRILPQFDPDLSASAERQLRTLGVEVRTGTQVKSIEAGRVVLDGETLEAETILWTAGVGANPLARDLGAPTDRAGRILVLPDCSVPGHPEVFAIGDLAFLKDAKGKAVPGVSPAAMQMGRYVAGLIEADLCGRPRPPAFAYWDKGSMATIGRSAAVAQIGRFKCSGFIAWILWLVVHLLFLIGFRNKISVLLQWFYSYVNYKRGARIITGLDRHFVQD
jgi:NADH dehydrogenase